MNFSSILLSSYSEILFRLPFKRFSQRSFYSKESLKAVNDFQLSPITGYTRSHWLEITEKIISGYMPYFDSETGMPDLPFKGDAFEKYRQNYQEKRIPSLRMLERMMIGVIFYSKATGDDRVSGFKGSITKPFIQAIINGTDTSSPFYWGLPVNGDQVGSVFALAIYVYPEVFWDPLSEIEKKNLLIWLETHVYTTGGDNNFYYFRMAVTSLLERQGMKSNREHLSKMFERLMGWHRGNGWYLDGVNRGFDYYNHWGFQMYNQILYRYDTVWRKDFGNHIELTSAQFLEGQRNMVGRNGAPVPWGRSLSYRFASIAPIGWAVLNGIYPLPLGEARRIASGVLKYFWENGCYDQQSGLIEPGFWGTNFSVSEKYLNPGDTYDAMLGMSCLLIPENHPFWTSVEQKIPSDGLSMKLAVQGPEFALRISPIDGDVRMFPVGQPFHDKSWMDQEHSKYFQHAYSSSLGFCVEGEGSSKNGAGKTGYSFDNISWSYRENPTLVHISNDHLVSFYAIRPKNVVDIDEFRLDKVITNTLVGTDGELHILFHDSPSPIFLHLGGYGIQGYAKIKTLAQKEGILVKTEKYSSIMHSVLAPEGKFFSKTLKPRKGWSHTHLFGGLGVFPYWRSEKPIPPFTPVIIYVNGAEERSIVLQDIKVKSSQQSLRIQFEGKWFDIPFVINN